jgi:hypothetical protein
LWRDDRWEAEEAAIKQPGLFGLAAPMAQAPVASEDTTNKTDEAADENSQVKAVVGPQAAQGPAQAKPSTAPSPWPGKPTGGQGGNGWSAKKW